MRRQIGAHTFAVSLDRDDILGAEGRTLLENMIAPSDDDGEETPSFLEGIDVAKILSVARFVSGKSSSDIARHFGVTPRRARQMLQQIREKKTIPKQFELCLEEAR